MDASTDGIQPQNTGNARYKNMKQNLVVLDSENSDAGSARNVRNTSVLEQPMRANDVSVNQ